ncbi:phosphate ABC transporter membrane protein 2 (PhoT family) [Rhodovulum imhoffii]|uniref:Phosphate transport system permease protein PstA n=1 Tax=Rhodovulum imhoffii TaxID=365340 RepID=A0A2T5BTS4_9RHOB|nr:phosphate ABC transporter permease PstA [Rhodovulum imhoffii]MBK5934123.1 phosphate ABC transporter, permease protein PstA [Rhodovulum imhoffii]PTN02804.1 phosphate ABC transporter membrane protein 2 (PhoT family) [Rhodovulum imhoffii]
MTDATVPPAVARPGLFEGDARTRKRNAAERRFRLYGMIAVGAGLFFLVTLLFAIVSNGIGAFQQTSFTLRVEMREDVLDKPGNRNIEDIKAVKTFAYKPLLRAAILREIEGNGIDTPLSGAKIVGFSSDLDKLLSDGAAAKLRNQVLANPELIGRTVEVTVLASSRVDGYLKGRVTRESIARDKNLDAEHLDLVDVLRGAGVVGKGINTAFITGTDASDARPEQAGMGVSILGSFFMMLVVLLLALPIGVAASIYLEEFAPQNRFTDLIEVNISNLAAVPSIVFGILGLAVFIQFMHLPQSAPLVGGLVLTLMTLPTIIISTRASLKSVPPSIRDAALGVGASKMQAVFHHVLPLAMPGILTGTIIGLAQALGETAPLLLIGMVGYIASNYPDGVGAGFLDPNSAMPAQIYEWAKRADPAFYERAWGGIIVLLVFLAAMNILAIILRRRFERRW